MKIVNIPQSGQSKRTNKGGIFMRRLISLLLSGTIVLLCGGVCSASDINGTDDFDLIEYCETHQIQSKEEFQSVLDYYVPQGGQDDDPDPIEGEEISFEIIIDYDYQTVTAVTLYEITGNRATKSGSVSADTYSSVGIKLFTVTTNGTFNYTSSNVNTTSASGSFTPATLSPWTSTPTISSGKVNGKAYARTSGTATFLGSSISYSLTLTCDKSGNLGSY